MPNEIAPNPSPGPMRERQVDIFDRDSPLCLLNLIPEDLATLIEDTVFEHENYFGKNESELEKYLRGISEQPTATDCRLRLSFWYEFDRVAEFGGRKRMIMANVTAGICPYDYFRKTYLKHPSKIAWLICPPVGYRKKTEEALDYAIDCMREILSKSLDGKDGPRWAAIKLGIMRELDARVRGAITQKIEHKSMQVNVTATPGEINQMSQGLSMQEMEKELQKLRDQDGSTRSRSQQYSNSDAIEVEVKHVSDNK